MTWRELAGLTFIVLAPFLLAGIGLLLNELDAR